jgi:hypothetical protein
MRLLHPDTIRTVAMVCKDEDFKNATVSRRSVISHAWSEVLKYMATKQNHPKMFLRSDYEIGPYMGYVKKYGDKIGCNLNAEHLAKYDDVYYGFVNITESNELHLKSRFDNEYLFSDCTSLYFKGLNIFPYVYGNDWRRLVPIESIDEIYRVVGKTIEKRKG